MGWLKEKKKTEGSVLNVMSIAGVWCLVGWRERRAAASAPRTEPTALAGSDTDQPQHLEYISITLLRIITGCLLAANSTRRGRQEI